jgi:hypothetical protein
VPSRAIRIPLEAAVVAAIGLAAAVAGLGAAAVIVVAAIAVALVGLSEFLISAREVTGLEPAVVTAPGPSTKPEGDEPELEHGPQAAVSERVARAILLSGQPPLPPEPPRAGPTTPPRPERQ